MAEAAPAPPDQSEAHPRSKKSSTKSTAREQRAVRITSGVPQDSSKDDRTTPGLAPHSISLFSHLLQNREQSSISSALGLGHSDVHPAVQRIAVLYAEGAIIDESGRCAALIDALAQVVNDFTFTRNESKDLRRDLHKHLNLCVQFVRECRPLSTAMENFVLYLNSRISHLPASESEMEGRRLILQSMLTFKEQKLHQAREEIRRLSTSFIQDGDVVLVCASSSLICSMLESAKVGEKSFEVVILESSRGFDGLQTAQSLAKLGVRVHYSPLACVDVFTLTITKVILGANAVFSNGNVLSRAGSAAVAALMHLHGKPVIGICETIHFSERAQLDAIIWNELGAPTELLGGSATDVNAKRAHAQAKEPAVLNLVHDVTPVEFITSLLTEEGEVFPASIPLFIEEHRKARLSAA